MGVIPTSRSLLWFNARDTVQGFLAHDARSDRRGHVARTHPHAQCRVSACVRRALQQKKRKRPIPMVPFFGECPLRAQDCTCASGHVCVVGGAGQPSGWLLCTPFVEHTGIVRVELPLTTAIRAVLRSPLLRGGFSRSSNPLCRCLSSPLPGYFCKDSLQQAPWSGTSLYEMLVVAFTFVHYDWS